MRLETKRVYLREMEAEDYPSLCKMLKDDTVMYAYGGALEEAEAQAWLERQRNRYQEDGFGLWAMVLKESSEMIGQCGLSMQPWKERCLLEIGYLLQEAFWHQGFATEAAMACKQYAFDSLGATEVFSMIRDTNVASQRVAERNGMQVVDRSVKRYRGIDMPHLLFAAKRKEQNV